MIKELLLNRWPCFRRVYEGRPNPSNVDLFESELMEIKIENILNLSEEKKNSFINAYKLFFLGKINLDKFKSLSPSSLVDSDRKNIFFEYVPFYSKESDKVDRVIILITDKTKEIESDKAIAERYELEMNKMELEYMMEHLYEQKHKRDVLINNLKEGYITINQEGIIEEGASRAVRTFLKPPFLNPKLKRLNFGTSGKKTKKKKHIKKWIETVWSGHFQFKDLLPGPSQFDADPERHIELEYRPIYDTEDGKKSKNGDSPLKNIIVIASDKTVEIGLIRKLNRDREEAYFIKTCLQNPEEFLDLINESIVFSLTNQILKLSRKAKNTTLESSTQ